tara:strand:+ start:144 stop:419 length:276 start_codon:yes stop_codon:yes gene_type:complete
MAERRRNLDWLKNTQTNGVRTMVIPFKRDILFTGKMYYKFLVWLMGVAGTISAWAWREHVKILRIKQDIQHKKLIRDQENQKYLEELVKRR